MFVQVHLLGDYDREFFLVIIFAHTYLLLPYRQEMAFSCCAMRHVSALHGAVYDCFISYLWRIVLIHVLVDSNFTLSRIAGPIVIVVL